MPGNALAAMTSTGAHGIPPAVPKPTRHRMRRRSAPRTAIPAQAD